MLKDFTQMEGEFDKISSIGMFEHVGIANHPAYFTAVHRLLRPRRTLSPSHHRAARQAHRQGLPQAKPEYKALTRYIFPGGELDHLGMSVANLERYGFEVHDVDGEGLIGVNANQVAVADVVGPSAAEGHVALGREGIGQQRPGPVEIGCGPRAEVAR